MSFSFGGTQPPNTAPFSFGQQQPQTTTSGFTFGTTTQNPSGFLFGGAQTTAPPSSFSFGTTAPVTTTPAGTTPGFSFGQTPSFGLAPASTVASSTGFGGFAATTAPAMSFGALRAPVATTATVPSTGLSFGGTTGFVSTPAGSTFGQPTTSVSSLPSFGTPAMTVPTQVLPMMGSTPLSLGGFSMTSTPAATTVASLPSYSTTVATSGNTFGLTSGFAASSTPATAASTGAATTSAGLTFGASLSVQQPPPKPTPLPTVSAAPPTSVTTANTGFTLTGQPAVTTTTALSFGTTTTPTLATVSVTSSVAPTTTTDSPAQPAKSTTFSQLEEAINKWNVELEEQERIFLSQATQVNAWDRLLVSNSEKITALNESVERVKLEQQRLDHELDFIVAQQRELEDLLVPLERSVDASPSLSIQQHADLEREHTYHLAENVDGQLKRMSEDIKKIIEHLNTTTREDENEPMQQISKILNAHMDALQWIDQNTSMLNKKVEEVTKALETTRKDQEKIFSYD